ncbi:TPA: hypothetical protein I7108_003486 [Vibrio cholerae O1]|uniref:hypothetical protein n=1 Tax=Vibrio cholerae TaxID=666 RepID=UPI001193E48A|nr:hypothetical protein [Vibrio cholerae]HAS6017050.1 hypothetical protein [Vibrio cholerae O1]EGR1049124.1 hypothetical protein [Vibrio cholerae]EGR3963819.1 hypothetical protein [Vibrio cholerae]EGR4347835.1 hypothetical protein [Vibrio cholerae]ELA3032930.1 hypothetical protein [Vibrio cholerae]
MRNLIILASVISVLSGCAGTQGQGEFFKLDKVHVIERNLGLFKEAQIVSTERDQQVQPVLARINTQYELRQGESYKTALERWIRDEGYSQIAWGMSPNSRAVLERRAPKSERYRTNLKRVVDELSKELDVTINLTFDKPNKVAGVYDFPETPRLVHVKGTSLKAVVASVVKHYGHKWDETGTASRSWLSPNDYQFGAEYFLLTRRDDLAGALKIVLADYPVYSSILDSTGQVFVQEEK